MLTSAQVEPTETQQHPPCIPIGGVNFLCGRPREGLGGASTASHSGWEHVLAFKVGWTMPVDVGKSE